MFYNFTVRCRLSQVHFPARPSARSCGGQHRQGECWILILCFPIWGDLIWFLESDWVSWIPVPNHFYSSFLFICSFYSLSFHLFSLGFYVPVNPKVVASCPKNTIFFNLAQERNWEKIRCWLLKCLNYHNTKKKEWLNYSLCTAVQPDVCSIDFIFSQIQFLLLKFKINTNLEGKKQKEWFPNHIDCCFDSNDGQNEHKLKYFPCLSVCLAPVLRCCYTAEGCPEPATGTATVWPSSRTRTTSLSTSHHESSTSSLSTAQIQRKVRIWPVLMTCVHGFLTVSSSMLIQEITCFNTRLYPQSLMTRQRW